MRNTKVTATALNHPAACRRALRPLSARPRVQALACTALLALGCVPRPPPSLATPRAPPVAELNVACSGSGPAVVLLHGLDSARDAWNGVDADLARDHSVLAVELPGFGPRPDAELASIDFPVIGRRIAHILESRELKDVVVVGHSIGGSIAPWVYAAAPNRVRSIVIIDFFMKPLPLDRAALDHLTRALRTDKHRALTEWFSHLARDAAQTESLVSRAMGVDARVLSLYLEEASVRDARPLLDGRPVPVHLMASHILAGDPPRSDAQILDVAGMTHFAHATVTVFRGAAHWIFLDERDAFLADLRRAIDETGEGLDRGTAMTRSLAPRPTCW